MRPLNDPDTFSFKGETLTLNCCDVDFFTLFDEMWFNLSFTRILFWFIKVTNFSIFYFMTKLLLVTTFCGQTVRAALEVIRNLCKATFFLS